MPNPTTNDVHIEQALSNISIAYKNEQYIADQVFPVVPVTKKSDYYFKFGEGAWFRDEVEVRAPGTRAQRADYTVTTASYVCINYALAKAVPDEVRKNADTPLRPEVESVEFVTDALLRARERRVASLITTSTNWAYSSSPATQWSSDTADPLGDIDNAINGVVSSIGVFPNTAVTSWDVWRKLKNHPDLLDRVKYTRPGGTPVPGDVADWFGIGKFLIGYSLYEAAKDGQSASMAYIWGDDFWVGYVPSGPALMTPAAGYVLAWEGRSVSRFREDQERQDVFEASENSDEVITGSAAGALVYDAV